MEDLRHRDFSTAEHRELDDGIIKNHTLFGDIVTKLK